MIKILVWISFSKTKVFRLRFDSFLNRNYKSKPEHSNFCCHHLDIFVKWYMQSWHWHFATEHIFENHHVVFYINSCFRFLLFANFYYTVNIFIMHTNACMCKFIFARRMDGWKSVECFIYTLEKMGKYLESSHF